MKQFGQFRLPDAEVVLEYVPEDGVPISVDAVLMALMVDFTLDQQGATVVLDRADAQGLVAVDHSGVVHRPRRFVREASA